MKQFIALLCLGLLTGCATDNVPGLAKSEPAPVAAPAVQTLDDTGWMLEIPKGSSCEVPPMMEFEDGAVLAQMGKPDMRGPISYALAHPKRINYGGEALDFTLLNQLTFDKPDTERFPCLQYAIDTLKVGGTAPVTLNGANEEAVAAFLRGEARFGAIPRAVYAALNECEVKPVKCEEDIYTADLAARRAARNALKRIGAEA